MALFVADPQVLGQEGNKQLGMRDNFVQNHQKIKTTINEMLSSAYVSPAARELGQKIASYDDTLNAMARTIGEYGEYLLRAGNKVTKNEQDIIDSIKPVTTDVNNEN